MKNKPAQLAFPAPLKHGAMREDLSPLNGMSLRDYFAAKAMHALLSHDAARIGNPIGLSVEAYIYADQMMKARI